MSALEMPVPVDVPLLSAAGDVPFFAGSLGRSFDVWCPPQRGEVIQLALSFRAMVFRPFVFHKNLRMRIYAHSLAR